MPATPTTPPPQRPLDELDQQIIDVLRARPREAVKDLAAELQVSQPTVASRIRAMDAAGVMRICAQRDFRAAGYEVLASVDVGVRGRPLNEIAHEVAEIDEVTIVTIAMGEHPLRLLVIARDLDDLYATTLQKLACISGVISLETMIISEVMKYRSDFAVLVPRRDE
jgi:Lrp/AsnC family leucine-responsive transcriptional regulator